MVIWSYGHAIIRSYDHHNLLIPKSLQVFRLRPKNKIKMAMYINNEITRRAVQLGEARSSKSMALSTNPPWEASKSMALSTNRSGCLDSGGLGAPGRPGCLVWVALCAPGRLGWLDLAALRAPGRPGWLDLPADEGPNA